MSSFILTIDFEIELLEFIITNFGGNFYFHQLIKTISGELRNIEKKNDVFSVQEKYLILNFLFLQVQCSIITETYI